MALIDTHKAVKQCITAGMSERQAEAITEIISSIDQHIATKGDILRLEGKIEADIARLEEKLDTHMKWLMTICGAILLLLIKLAFFNV